MVENPRQNAQSSSSIRDVAGISCQRVKREETGRYRGNDVVDAVLPIHPTLLSVYSGLSFTATALRRSHSNPSEELSDSFNQAYNVTLKQYHSFVVRPVFAVNFYKRMYANNSSR